MAELVCEQIRGRALVTDDDRPPERIAVVPTEPGHPKQSRFDEDADSRERDRGLVEIEPVESCLRPFEALSLVRESAHAGVALDARWEPALRGSPGAQARADRHP